MRHYHLNKAALWRPVINVDKLAVSLPPLAPPTPSQRTKTPPPTPSQTLIPAEQREGLSSSSTVVPVVDTLAAVRLALAPSQLPSTKVNQAANKNCVPAGLRQGPRQGPSPRVPGHRQGPLRLAPRRGQDQGQRWCRLDRRIKLSPFFLQRAEVCVFDVVAVSFASGDGA